MEIFDRQFPFDWLTNFLLCAANRLGDDGEFPYVTNMRVGQFKVESNSRKVGHDSPD